MKKLKDNLEKIDIALKSIETSHQKTIEAKKNIKLKKN